MTMLQSNKKRNNMKVLILTDLEGITGVSAIEQIAESSPDYPNTVRLLMQDVNTAIQACFDAKVEHVYVIDGHSRGENFDKSALDKRAEQVYVRDMGRVIKEVDCLVCIGMHAMAGTYKAFLDHTQWSERFHYYYYNDVKIGEIMQSAVFGGAFNVPLVMVSGDESACKEAKHFIDGVYTAPIKTATERNRAVCIDEKTAVERIYNAVKSGIENYDKIQPIKMALPFTIRIEFNRSDYCDEACRNNPSIKRLDVYNAESVKTEIKEWKDVLL